MKNCIFCHYSNKSIIPNYVLYYIEILKPKFNIHLLTNVREIDNLDILEELNVDIYFYNNEGMDFGMYYKFLSDNDITGDTLIINDSVILFNSLDNILEEVLNSKEDLVGLTSSNEISYHIQSYFWYLKSDVFEIFKDYLRKEGLKKDYDTIVHIYEIGFNNIIVNNGYNTKAIFEYIDDKNPTIHHPIEIIKHIPIIKKKIYSRYLDIIRGNKSETLNLNFLLEDI